MDDLNSYRYSYVSGMLKGFFLPNEFSKKYEMVFL